MIDEKTEADLLSLLQDLRNLEHNHPDVLSENFNIFEAAGLVRQEIRHSNILAFLINPNESHGLKEVLLRQIVDIASMKSAHKFKPNLLTMALGDFDDVIVHREDMHIDILAWSPKNEFVIAIENKVDASEGVKQLEEYREKLFKDSRFYNLKKLFIYLTADGEEPSDDEWWVSISYNEILDSLNEALDHHVDTMSEDARLFVKHYIDLIRRFIVNEVNPDLKKACMSLHEKHKRIIKIIMDNLESPRNEAIKSFLSNQEIAEVFSSKSKLIFLTKDLFESVPKVIMTRKWDGQDRPIIFWFSFQETKIGLIVEVGPWQDISARNQLVNKLNKAIHNEERDARTDTYTRIWRHNETITSEPQAEEIKEIMNTLFLKLQQDEVIKAISKVVAETWPNINKKNV